ncbi:hypothetical protein LINPERHAP1_LOCUS18294 [Linum perenne]
MDKSWMEKRRFSVEYIEGVCSFMHFVQDHLGHDIDIHCPCKSCLNVFHEPQEVVLSHLMINGIDVGYTRWVYHGEQFNTNVNDLNILDNDVVQEDEDKDENEDEEDHLFDLLDEHELLLRKDKDARKAIFGDVLLKLQVSSFNNLELFCTSKRCQHFCEHKYVSVVG